MDLSSLISHLESRQPACGTTAVVAVDGRSGAGKSSFADALAARWGASVLRLDDLVPGWYGLDATVPILRGVLASLAVGEPGVAHRWDWEHDRPGEMVEFVPVPRLVIDGCGSGAAVIRPFLVQLLWVESPPEARYARAMARDGDTYRPWWDVWAQQEDVHYRREATRAFADVVVGSR